MHAFYPHPLHPTGPVAAAVSAHSFRFFCGISMLPPICIFKFEVVPRPFFLPITFQDLTPPTVGFFRIALTHATLLSPNCPHADNPRFGAQQAVSWK